jgi:hypothetical protein
MHPKQIRCENDWIRLEETTVMRGRFALYSAGSGIVLNTVSEITRKMCKTHQYNLDIFLFSFVWSSQNAARGRQFAANCEFNEVEISMLAAWYRNFSSNCMQKLMER